MGVGTRFRVASVEQVEVLGADDGLQGPEMSEQRRCAQELMDESRGVVDLCLTIQVGTAPASRSPE